MKMNRLFIPSLVGMFVIGIFTGRFTAPKSSIKEQSESVVKLTDTTLRPSNAEKGASTFQHSSKASLFDSVSADSVEHMARTAAASLDDVENESMLRVLVSEWAKKDPYAAIAYTQELGRSDFAYDVLEQWARHSPDEALSWIQQNENNGGQRRYLKMGVYQGMAQTDPLGALERVERLSVSAQRDELMAIVIDEWAKQDVHSVFAWLETTELTPQFSNIYSQAMGRYIEQDPVTAASLISEMRHCDEKVSFASQAAVKLAEHDVDYALEWVETLDSRAKKYALQGVIDRWSKGDDADAALDYVINDDVNLDFKNLFTAVAINISHSNPDLLTDAFDQMNEVQQQISAQQLAQVFSVDNPDRGLDWVRSLAPGVVQDAAIESTLRSFKNTNVAEAFELSEIISDASMREEQIREVLTAWIPVDQQAAEQALHASPAIVSSEKGNLLNGVYQNLKPSDYVLPAKP